MYRPLYMFGNNGPSVAVNYPLSPANAPVYSNGGKTVTITMKGWKWSNGETVDASDVIFWLNMMKAEPDNYYGYVPGLLPDNLASYSATAPNTVVINLKSSVSSIWFTYNQLAEITPMPAAWDVTAAGAKAGSGGCATDTAADKLAKCKAVYAFMSAQAKNAPSLRVQPRMGASLTARGSCRRSAPPPRARLPRSCRTRPTRAARSRSWPSSRTTPTPMTRPSTRRSRPAASTSATFRRRTSRRCPAGRSCRRPTRSAALHPVRGVRVQHRVLHDQLQQPGARPGVPAAVRAPGAAGTGRPGRHDHVGRPRLRLPDLGRRADPAEEPVGSPRSRTTTAGRARTPSPSRTPPACSPATGGGLTAAS